MLPLRQVFHERKSTRFGVNQAFASLTIGSYRAFWISLLASYVGLQMNIVIRGYLAFLLTGSATALGIVSLARGFAMLCMSPLAGVVADRVDKKRLLIFVQMTLLSVALTTSLLVHFHLIQFWHLVVLSLVEGTAFSFNMPTRQAILPQLVPQENLANAIALNSSGRNLMRIVGPSIAGVAIGVSFLGVSGAFDLVAAAYAVGATLLARLETLGQPVNAARSSRRGSRGVRALGDGFRYILGNQKLRLLLVLGFVPVLLGNPYMTLLPVFQARVLGVNATGLGMLYAAAGVGGLIGTLIVASLANHPGKASLQLVFGSLFGTGLLLFSLVHVFAIDLVLLVLVGLAGDSYSTLNSTMVMLNTEQAWYGRVMGVYLMNFSLMPLASLPLGTLADLIGAPHTVTITSSIIIALILSVGFLYPSYRKVGEIRQEESADVAGHAP